MRLILMEMNVNIIILKYVLIINIKFVINICSSFLLSERKIEQFILYQRNRLVFKIDKLKLNIFIRREIRIFNSYVMSSDSNFDFVIRDGV